MGTHIKSKASPGGAALSHTRAAMESFRAIVRGLRHSSQQSQTLSGLTSAQFFVLQQIHSREGLSMNELADLSFTHQSTVSETVGRLVTLKLVSKLRSKRDSRSVALAVTKLGASKLGPSVRTAQEALIHAILSLAPKKRRDLAKLLADVARAAGFSDRNLSLFFEEKPRKAKNEK